VVIAIAGAHGKIARRLTRLLAGSGHSVIGLIRNPDQADHIREDGASAVVCDLERATAEEIAAAIDGADAAVFAAGAGPGSDAERKLTMDRDGAVKLVDAARRAGVPRFLIVSSVGAENPPEGDDAYSVYQQAKAAADQAVQASDLAWTIIRPGRLTDGPGTGRVRIEADPFRGEVPRDDVAAVLARVLDDERLARRVLYVNGGDDPIERALEEVLGHG
jgi:nucleoside-diphosphate-sugar epimerase